MYLIPCERPRRALDFDLKQKFRVNMRYIITHYLIRKQMYFNLWLIITKWIRIYKLQITFSRSPVTFSSKAVVPISSSLLRYMLNTNWLHFFYNLILMYHHSLLCIDQQLIYYIYFFFKCLKLFHSEYSNY